jgi:hypothetical protein
VTGAELDLPRRQHEALVELQRLANVDFRQADETYESKYRDVLAHSIYDDLKRKILRQQATEKRQRELEEEKERQRLEREQKRRELEEKKERDRHEREKKRHELKERKALIEAELSAALSESLVKESKVKSWRISDSFFSVSPTVRE